jgi:hypothetical protein
VRLSTLLITGTALAILAAAIACGDNSAHPGVAVERDADLGTVDGALESSASGDVMAAPYDAPTDGQGMADALDVDGADASSGTTLLLLGCGGGMLTAASYSSSTGWSTLTVLGTSCDGAPAMAPVAGGAVAMARQADDTLATAIYGASGWAHFAPILLGRTAAQPPALTVTPTGVYAAVVFSVPNSNAGSLEGITFGGGTWANTTEPIASPVLAPPSLASNGPTVFATFRAGSPTISIAARAPTWSAPVSIASTDDLLASPVVTTGVATPDLEVVYRDGHGPLWWTGRSAGTWLSPSEVGDSLQPASTTGPFAVTRTMSGAMLLAYVAPDGSVYARRQVMAGMPFSAAVTVDGSGDVTSVALADGIDGYDAELVTTSGAGTVRHFRLNGATWSAPTVVPGATLSTSSLIALP